MSNMQDLVSHNNFISFISQGDGIKVGALSENSGDALPVLKVKKPIVPKDEYIPKVSDKEIKISPRALEVNAQPPNSNLGWL